MDYSSMLLIPNKILENTMEFPILVNSFPNFLNKFYLAQPNK